MEPILLITLFLVLLAEWVNGWTDAPNAIATAVTTRVITPITAVILAVLLNIVGALAGTKVAHTIGQGIVDSSVINIRTIAAAMMAMIIWSSLAAWTKGIPTSESHALIAGLAGAGLATAGPSVLLWSGWQKVIWGLLFSTVLGFALSFFIARAIQAWFATCHPTKTHQIFAKLQIASAGFMAFNHGMNDGQKFIGIFSLTLLLGGVTPEFQIPWWTILLCSFIMGIGTSYGGWKIIRTMGNRMVKELRPWQGFSAETGAAAAILSASLLGIPLSTTHTITNAITGVAVARRPSSVRWHVSAEIVLAWFLTFPSCAAIAFLMVHLLRILGV